MRAGGADILCAAAEIGEWPIHETLAWGRDGWSGLFAQYPLLHQRMRGDMVRGYQRFAQACAEQAGLAGGTALSEFWGAMARLAGEAQYRLEAEPASQ